MTLTNSPGCEFRLRVERGQTKFPERPISTDRFLIGAGSNCHLQLGGEMPILHSIIVASEEGLWIDATVMDPPLLVNRQPVREGQLHVGDLIEIGSFLFRVESQPLSAQAEIEVESEAVDLAELSAENLVDLMQSEIDAINAIEQAKTTGAMALMQAIKRAGASDSETTEPKSAEDELSRRQRELETFEKDLRGRADQLQAAQNRLANLLKELSSRQPTDGDGDDPIRLRA